MSEYQGYKIMIDKRIKRFVEGTLMGKKNEFLDLHLNDIDMSFCFEDYSKAQEFLHTQAVERVYDKELRKGYFDYTNEYNEKMRIVIKGLNRGKITSFEDVCVEQ